MCVCVWGEKGKKIRGALTQLLEAFFKVEKRSSKRIRIEEEEREQQSGEEKRKFF